MPQSQYRSEVEGRLAESWPTREWSDAHVVLGVSGGSDSVAMLRAMISLKESSGGSGKLYVAHLNHGMRGAAAEDEAWLKALCRRLNVPLETARTDVTAIAAEQGDGWEAAARAARYDFLRQMAEQLGARFVVTAHNADDQVETVLHRILRGTGLEGLAGVPKVRPLSTSVTVVRPLLTVWRRELVEYLATIGQDFRIDETNKDISWTRNRLRHELLPQLRDRYNSRTDTAVARLAAQAGEAQQIIVGLAAKLARGCVVADKTRARIDCEQLVGQPPIVVCEVCKLAWSQAGWPEQSMGFDQWQQLAALAGGLTTQIVNLPGNIRAYCEARFLVLEHQA